MDFNQKVNSLIESPVRPPLKTAPPPVAASKQRQPQPQQQQQSQSQSQRQPANFAQLAVSRAQQTGSQALNAGLARKSLAGGGFLQQLQQQQQQQQQQQSYDSEADEQQQQQNFDDSPVQTSTAQSSPFGGANQNQAARANLAPQQQTTSIQSADGSSAITTQYDTIVPVGGGQSQLDQTYESSIDDSASGSSEDFRSSGAKAAASQNQNWYIMRTI